MVSADMASGSSDLEQTVDKRGKDYYCGARLADVLDLVCQYRMGKRSWIGKRESLRPELSIQHLSVSSVPNAAYQRIEEVSDVRTKRSGIVEECCLNPCSLSTLAKYCW